MSSSKTSGQEKYEEIIIENKIYKPGSNWLSIGAGLSYNFDRVKIERDINVSYHQRIKNHHFNIGYHTSREESFLYISSQRLNDLYLGYGWRWEKQKTQQSLFLGTSYSWGGSFHHNETTTIDSVTIELVPFYRYFVEPGLYVNYCLTYKFYYDLGLSANFFVSANQYYQVAGIRFSVYFSGAYKGKIE